MIQVEMSIVIGRAAEDVLAYVSDRTHAPRWQRGLPEVRRTTAGPIGVGTRHPVVRSLFLQLALATLVTPIGRLRGYRGWYEEYLTRGPSEIVEPEPLPVVQSEQ